MRPSNAFAPLNALRLTGFLALTLGLTSLTGCPIPGQTSPQVASSGVFSSEPFVETLVLGRTFTDGSSVTTAVFEDRDDGLGRRPFGIDFNDDNMIDPVVGYGGDIGVIQILLSNPQSPGGDFTSLTIDSQRDMRGLADVAAGDIDGDGRLDVVAGAQDAVWYFRQPEQGPTFLRGWGAPDSEGNVNERIEASNQATDPIVIQEIIRQTLPFVNFEDYIVTVTSNYTDVEIGDFDNDGWEDIAATRLFEINLEPRPTSGAEPATIFDGDISVFLNPGAARDGREWAQISVGQHERLSSLDRDSASTLLAYDLDADGDLDLVTGARNDNNVQVAWFENPLGGAGSLRPDIAWRQWRVGSVRDNRAIDVIDLTGDGRVDVVATGGAQQQVILFRQPSTGPKREFDWESSVVATFESFEPRDVQALDLDQDGTLELVVGATGGAVRYFEPNGDPANEWVAFRVFDFVPEGIVGNLGYGDIDGDSDLDLVAVVAGTEPNASKVSWIRNDLR